MFLLGARVYYIYVLYSWKDGGMYIGQTEHLIERVKQHQLGKVTSTRGRRPFSLVYWEVVLTREEALNRELGLKTNKGRRYIRKRLCLEIIDWLG
jgi:putative endonuclease